MSSDIYETIALRADPVYDGIDVIIEALEAFIREHGLIIYGGLAIDYALRLRGGKIYPDDLLQIDYDFMSPDSVNHAYAIADLFHSLGRESRAINASHVGTMRVDVGDSHFLADVSYMPREIFHAIPTVEWRGMKCIHPDLQRIDMHHALAFPYEYAPMESIFNRWRKDVKRFGMLAEAYPIECEVVTSAEPIVRVRNDNSFIWGADAAYAIMYTTIAGDGVIPDCYESRCTYEDGFVTFRGNVVVLSSDPDKAALALGCKGTRYHEFINLTPVCVHGTAPFGSCTIVDTSEDLVSFTTWNVGNKTIRIASAQWCSMWYLGQYHRSKIEGKEDRMMLYKYTSLQRLISLNARISGLSIDVYGHTNTNLSKKVQTQRLLKEKGMPAQEFIQPRNYTPGKGPSPTFSYDDNVIYMRSGTPTA